MKGEFVMYYDERENNLFSKNENELEIETNLEQNFTNINDNTSEIKFDINNVNINNFRENKKELYSLEEGLNKGNSFKDEYIPYKNYIYRVVVKGDRDKLLLKVQELTFRLIDLNIYLDLYPNSNLYIEFKKTLKELKETKQKYEKNYGPLCLEAEDNYNSYLWSKNPWPWMNEGGKN